jgi:hypothetical protein
MIDGSLENSWMTKKRIDDKLLCLWYSISRNVASNVLPGSDICWFEFSDFLSFAISNRGNRVRHWLNVDYKKKSRVACMGPNMFL